MTTLLLLTALLAQTDEAALSIADLMAINGSYEKLAEFGDNVFIQEEKLAEVGQEAKGYVAREVQLEVTVQEVNKSGILTDYFVSVDRERSSPRLILVNDAEFDLKSIDTGRDSRPEKSESYVGSVRGGRPLTRGKGLGHLAIGELLPLELAKTMREDDRLRISGTVLDVATEKSQSLRDANKYQYLARIVIVVNKIEKLEDADE